MNEVNTQIQYRIPNKDDGKIVYQLIKDSQVLDLNSLYCYLIVCDHFQKTSIIAEYKSEVVGFISGYLIPENPNVLFIWQVVVKETMKKKGIALSMILSLLKREELQSVNTIMTTVTPSNIPSKKMFYSAAKNLNTNVSEDRYFLPQHFGQQSHEEEVLFTIGPFQR